MNEKPEIPSKPSRRTFLKAAGATAAAVALAPHEALAQAASDYEQTPDFFAKKMTEDLKAGKTIRVAEGIFRIASNTEKLDHFSEKAVLSEDLREAPFMDPKTPLKLAESEEIHNPVIVEHGGSQYFVYRTTLENGEKKVVAVALRPSNWNNISRMDKDQTVNFDKNNPKFFQEVKMQVEGMAETNFNKDLSPEIFATNITSQERHIPIMRSVIKKTT